MMIKWIVIGLLIWEGGSLAGTFLGSILELIPAVGYTLKTIFVLAGGAAGIFLAYKIAYGKYKAEKKAAEVKMNKLLKQSEAEVHAAQEIFDEHAAEMDFLPVDYWYPMATSYLIKILKTGRVHSLAEALDKYDDQLHRWKLEEANAQLVAQQEQQTAYLASIKRSSNISAAANVTNTVFNIARHL